ncbi:MAG: TonB-dependent receptor [Gammaproteobacteria bacterium]|nr:TonB-dependent receptor [Gammaproteobacteria bacterium]
MDENPWRRGARVSVAAPCALAVALATLTPGHAAANADASGESLETITVSAQRLELLGTVSSASEGVVAQQEIQLAPAYRPGQILETVPGLIVTLHSGEGKANQYLMRGYNLDHGTDLATVVDGMPINQPTHAHGQGYTDLNFVIPELLDGIRYTKGPYYAEVGDFGSVGSVRLQYRDEIPTQIGVGAGTFDFRRVLAAGSMQLGAGRLLAALEGQHYDGPFLTPDDARKANAVLRYSDGDERQGLSLTAMYYHQSWTNTTDIPMRAIDAGVVPDRFGTLDPTDGGRAQRASLSAQFHEAAGSGQLAGGAWFIYNQLDLYNNFTHYLVDPVHGDQEHQFENRHVGGGSAAYTLPVLLGPVANEIGLGALARYDSLAVGRLPSAARAPLPPQADAPSFSNSDQVYLFSGALYGQATSRWTPWFRSVLGVRADYQHGTDIDYLAALHESAGYTNGGTKSQTLVQPKASFIFTVNPALEFYLSGGEGFHSADLRGVNQDRSVDLGLPNTPLLAAQWGEEIGLRAQARRALAVTFALYNLWQQSETILNPDVGQDTAGPPSKRYGFELNATWQMREWLEFYGSVSANHTRFTRPFDDGTGHLGTYITDAPAVTGSLALYLTGLGPWSGGLEYRYLGDYPLSSGPCVDAAAARDFPHVATSCAQAPTAPGQVNGHGFGQLNLDARYAFRSGWNAALGVYNLLNTHAPAAQFWYVDRLQSEAGAFPDGRADVHQHPLEPLMARLTLVRVF